MAAVSAGKGLLAASHARASVAGTPPNRQGQRDAELELSTSLQDQSCLKELGEVRWVQPLSPKRHLVPTSSSIWAQSPGSQPPSP